MNDDFLVDSNILIYAFDRADKKKHLRAKELLTKCWLGEIILVTSLQNLSEFFVNVTKKISKPISETEATDIVKSIIDSRCWTKIAPKPETLLKAMKLSAENKTSYWDSLIAATMIENGIFHLYTENTKDFSKINEITAKNLFTNEKLLIPPDQSYTE